MEPEIVPYLETPPDRETLAKLIADAGLSVRDAIRQKGTSHEAMGLADPSLGDDVLLDSMIGIPVLINRPFGVTPLGVRLCRPSERLLEIMPSGAFSSAFAKEDGEPVLDGNGRPIAD